MLTEEDTIKQSKTAMKQWEDLWRVNATKNNELYKKNPRLDELLFRGKGKTAVALCFGATFEDDLHIVSKWKKEKPEEFDVIAIDKCVKYLDFAPDYVVVADASVSKEWFEGVDTSKSTLVCNICANPEWPRNWKGKVYFYVNKDNIQTEKVFGVGGCSDVSEMIPAASNVGNAAVVIGATVLDYDRILLCGYDYCYDDRYYAFYDTHDDELRSKMGYMTHRIAIDHSGRIVKTSENLLFSSRWLSDFTKSINGKVYNTTKKTIAQIPFMDLDRQLEIAKKRTVSQGEKDQMVQRLKKQVLARNDKELNQAMTKKVTDIVVSYLPEVHAWIN